MLLTWDKIPGALVGRVITIDPGVREAGLAVWKELRPHVAHIPLRAEVLKTKPTLDWGCAMFDLVEQVEHRLAKHRPNWVVMEWQEVWTTSAASMASASTGNLLKLTLATGMLVRLADARGAAIVLAKPGEWKGQLSKAAVIKRITRATGKTYRSHAADAVGIGLAVSGVL